MTTKSLRILLVLTLCLCALLCGSALADGYSVTTTFPAGTCTVVTAATSQTNYDTAGNLDGVEAGTRVSLEVVPLTGYTVSRVECSYSIDGNPYVDELEHDAASPTMYYFTMPAADVQLEVIIRQEGDVYYPLTASTVFSNCRSITLQTAGGQSGTEVEAMAGETVTVTAVPETGYAVIQMHYVPMGGAATAIEFTVAANGTATGSFAMPGERAYVEVKAGQPGVSYISYSSSGVSQGEQTCTDYQLLTNSSATWYDLSSGWYGVQGNVTLSSDTTLRITGDVHLILCDGARLTAGDGVYIKKGSSLSIYGQSMGTGKLIAKPDSGPGIGGMADTVAGSLYIHGGVIDAKGGTNAAGIGGGNHSSGYQNIVIYGGDVTAQGGSSGAGIGKGQQNSPSDCGTIAIYGGTVKATGGDYGAGIGGGEDRDGGNIAIYGGTVTATGGHDGAGIGGGEGGSGGDIAVYGGRVNATGGRQGAGIGGGEDGNGGSIVIQGGTVEAQAGFKGAGIGGGERGSGGSIAIHGGKVEAYGTSVIKNGHSEPDDNAYGASGIEGGAAIGGGNKGNAGTILIDGGDVTASGNVDNNAGPGIGAGFEGETGSITIAGGTVSATANNGSGIGGSLSGKDFKGSITITDGNVYAYSYDGAGIGSKYFYGTVSISGGSVRAESGRQAAIGGGYDCGGTVKITGGSVTVSVNNYYASSQAIGHGDSSSKEGTVIIGDQMKVTAGDNISGGDAATVSAADRARACRRRYARIEACTAHEPSVNFVITEDTHTGRCLYCNGLMEEENHIYEDGICGVCGYAGSLVTIHYLPGSENATGTMAAEACLPNAVYFPADCLFAYFGYEFAGWRLNDTDAILSGGTECRFDTETTLTATWRNNWSDLQAAINAAESGAVIRLDGDTVASVYDSPLRIPADKSITLDLNGCELSRGLTKATDYGQVIANYGTLTVTDSVGGGVITGGYNASGFDGGGITNSGTLILEGGTIIGNQAVNSAGGVRNASGATFTMTGGAIEGNTCGSGGGGGVVNYGTMNLSGGTITGNTSGQNGGGIWSNGTLNISGGSITGNTANDKGAGIYAHGNGTLTLSGSPVITGNSSTQRGTNNLHINQDGGRLPAITAGDLTEDSLIGVFCSVAPTESTPVAIASGVTGELPQIVSDANAYAVTYESGRLYLALAPTYTVTVSAEIEHGTVTADPASGNAGDTVTLTVEAEENYILASLTVTPEGGEAEALLPDAGTGAYSFILPAANVTVSASFIQDKTSAAVRLVWDDGENASGRPDSLYVTLLDLGEPVRAVELTASAGWTATQTGLPMDHSGELASYTWTIQNADVPAGYSLTGSTVSGELTTLTLTPAQPVIIAQSENGTVTASKREAAPGETVAITVTPDPGYRLKTLTFTAGGEVLSVAFNAATETYSFVMPGQTVTVTAVFEKIPTDWELLQGLIDAAAPGETITLTQNHTGVTNDAPLKVVSGQKVTINLNGFNIAGGTFGGRIFTVNGGELTVEGSGTITGGAAGNSVGGAFIVQGGGSLTLNGGTVSGNEAGNGGGAVAVTNGTFTMNGGEISGNNTEGHGGAVRMQGGTFVMNGGIIRSNTAVGNGGGLWVGEGSTVCITGGSVGNNSAALGSGVYLNSVGMAVTGSPDIGEAYVFNTVITVEGALDPDARIGLTCSNSAAKNGTVLTNGLTGNGALANFPSVKNGYASALNADGEVYFATARTVTLDLNDGSGHTEEIRVADGTALAEPESPKRAGYVFLSWQLNGADYDFAAPVTEDITLTAQWLEVPPFGTPDFTLPAGMQAIEASAFEGAAMTVVLIPDGCESIGDYAFENCGNLTQIRIPADCQLGEDVFSGCELVYVFGAAGSDADAYCSTHANCVFVEEQMN